MLVSPALICDQLSPPLIERSTPSSVPANRFVEPFATNARMAPVPAVLIAVQCAPLLVERKRTPPFPPANRVVPLAATAYTEPPVGPAVADQEAETPGPTTEC